VSQQPEAAVDTGVLAVSQTMNLLVIAAGSELGLEPGMELTLHRGDEYVGKVVIEKASHGWSSCRIIKEFESSKPQVGDQASSKIY